MIPRILFTILYPLFWLSSWLPMRILYFISDIFYLIIYHLVKYRRNVVRTNLVSSYPNKELSEIIQIEKGYYHHLCDLLIEFWKQITASKSFLENHVELNGFEKIQDVQESNQSIMMVMGHVNSWEWAAQKICFRSKFPFYILYRPLKNKQIDKLVLDVRTKFGTELIGMNAIVRYLAKNRDNVVGGCFIADQNPPKQNALWANFLRKETAFFSGFQKLSRKFGQPVYFLEVFKVSRGKYRCTLEELIGNPKEMTEEEMTQVFANRLEKQIDEQPSSWLWSHRRWKYHRNS